MTYIPGVTPRDGAAAAAGAGPVARAAHPTARAPGAAPASEKDFAR
jgi:hypothetical protein